MLELAQSLNADWITVERLLEALCCTIKLNRSVSRQFIEVPDDIYGTDELRLAFPIQKGAIINMISTVDKKWIMYRKIKCCVNFRTACIDVDVEIRT